MQFPPCKLDCANSGTWSVDTVTGLCASCLYDAVHEATLAKTWEHPEDSAEYAEAERQLDALELGGVHVINAELWRAQGITPNVYGVWL